jgi:hypothetical protein
MSSADSTAKEATQSLPFDDAATSAEKADASEKKGAVDLERADVISLSAPPLLSPARLRVIFFALGMAVALAALEQTIVSTALASISSDLTGGDDQVSHS